MADQCIYTAEGKFGCQAGNFYLLHLYGISYVHEALPWGLQGCMFTGFFRPPKIPPIGNTKCACSGDNCSRNPPNNTFSDRPLIKCHFSTDGIKPNTCYGHYCSISEKRDIVNDDVVRNCVLFTGDYQPLAGCYQTKEGTPHVPELEVDLTECICQTPCNNDIASAVASVESMPMPTLPTLPTTTTTKFVTTTGVPETTGHEKTTTSQTTKIPTAGVKTTTTQGQTTTHGQTTTKGQTTTTRGQTTTKKGIKMNVNWFVAFASAFVCISFY